MTSEMPFENLRTASWKSILSRAFKAFPKRVEEIIAKEGWKTFVDFMAAVERSGRVILQFKKPLAKNIEEKGVEWEIARLHDEANTEAAFRLLGYAFSGWPDRKGLNEDELLDFAREALLPFEVHTWKDFSKEVLEIALVIYEEQTGTIPLETAEAPTQLFYNMRGDTDSHVMMQVAEAFGLATPLHYTVLLITVDSGEVTTEDLDRAVGHPEILTEVVDRSPSNPKKGIVFSAPVCGPPPPAPTLSGAVMEISR